jgi:N-acetyl-gamma-glutamyl-phosphate reductase
MKMIRVGIVGATGYAGAELVRLLAGHPAVELTLLTSRQYAGKRFDAVFPSMAGVVDLVCRDYSLDVACDRTDIIFMALPHQLPMSFIPPLLENGKRVIDLSADFRFRNVAVYEQYYQPHQAAHLIDESVYGLSEIYGEQIKKARLIGNPGCYPTSVLLPLIPLLKNGLITPDTIIADSKSGVSGAGRSLSLTAHYCEVQESFKAYKVGQHRHNPEMDEVLSIESEKTVSITFVPHLVPLSRGMLTTLYTTPEKSVSTDGIRSCLASFYAGRHFVRLCPDDKLPDTRNVRGTNFCDIGFKLDAPRNRLILISAIDNLVKGAAGQAVQNMNLMLGLDETTGLRQVPYPI